MWGTHWPTGGYPCAPFGMIFTLAALVGAWPLFAVVAVDDAEIRYSMAESLFLAWEWRFAEAIG